MEHLLGDKSLKNTIREYVMIVLALFPFALMVNWIFVPQNVVGAGLTGICSIIYYATQGLFTDFFPEYAGSIPLWLSSLTINIILLIINHINQKIDINPMQRTKSQVSYLKQGESLPGGNTAIYVANLLIRFHDNSKLKPDEAFGIAGNLVDLGLVKSRNNRAGKTCTLVFNQDRGFDPELSLFVMLKNAKRIGGAGAHLYIGDRSDIKFSQKTFKEKLRENPELYQIFIKEVMELLKEDLDRSAIESNPASEPNYSLANDILSQLNPPM
jgi:hypothetical protein